MGFRNSMSGPLAAAIGALLLTFSAGASASRFAGLADLHGGVTASVPATPAVTDAAGVYFVQLTEAPAAVVFAEAMRGASRDDTAARNRARVATQSRVASIRDAQDALLAQIGRTAPTATTLYRVEKSANAIVMQLSGDDVTRIRALPGVRSVQFMEPEYPTLGTSVPFIGSPEVWDGAGLDATGEGVSIAIIDSGVDYQHPTFGGTGLLADYQANDRTTIGETGAAAFPTARVVGGWDFAGDAYTAANAPAPDPDPMDCGSHGTHVASTVAGGGVNADGTAYTGPYDTTTDFGALRIGPGVAPKAELYALRVFGCGGSTNLTMDAIEWAMDPNDDGDLSDHVDVINMSLGSNFGSVSVASAVASDNAALAGVIVVASAGNAGDTFTISGAPGSSTRTIAVANIADDGVAGALIDVNSPPSLAGPKIAANSAYTAPGPAPAPSGQTADVIVGAGGPNPAFPAAPPIEGCGPYTNAAAVAGKIAMVRRGNCGFALKAEHAQNAGAIGVIIFNNAVGDPAPPGMGGAPTMALTIPAVSTTLAVANEIIAAIASDGAVNVTLATVDGGDVVNASSSRGPRGGDLAPKPDVAAPGTAIIAAQTGVVCTAANLGCIVPNPSGYIAGGQALTLSGTSMAAPHVAGLAALLRELNPTRSVEEIKAAVMNGAIHDVTLGAEGSGGRLPTSRVGAGRVDALESAALEITAFNADGSGGVGVGFDGEIAGSTTQTREIRLANHGSTTRNLTLDFDTILDSPGVDFVLPGGNSVSIAAGQSVTLQVQMVADSAAMEHPRDPTLAATQAPPAPLSTTFAVGPQGRHWLAEESAVLAVSEGANLVARVPVYSAPRAMAAVTVPAAIDVAGAPTGTQSIAMAGTGLCTGTLAGGECAVSEGDVLSVSTAFELQAISPRDTSIPAYNDIRYVGVASNAELGQPVHYFGIGLHGRTEVAFGVTYQVEIDNNNDGITDRTLFSGDSGTIAARLFNTANVFAQDVNVLMTLTPPTSASYVGLFEAFDPRVIDMRIHGTDVAFMHATPTQLGLASATAPFRYRVSTCFQNFPMCNFLNTAARFDSTGWLSWNPAAKGVGVAPFLSDAQPGNALDVTWNTANLAANNSLGVLLLQHHNDNGMSQQVITFENTDNDVAEAAADVGVTLSVDATSPSVGDEVTFTVTAQHSGPAATTDIATAILPPDGLTFVSTSGDGSYDPGTGVWTVAAAASGVVSELELVAEVNRSGPITLDIDAMGLLVDPNLVDNHAAVSLAAANSSDISVAVTPSASSVAAGEEFTVVVSVSNDGPDSAYSINATSAFEAAATPSAVDASAGVFDAGTGVWNIASLADGATETLTLTYTVTTPGSYDFDATAIIADNDPTVPNDDAETIVVTAGAVAELVLVGGSDQQTVIGNTFPQPLTVRAEDAFDNPVSGVDVTFTAPASGASATFPSGATVVTGANGEASLSAQANAVVGAYDVEAEAGSITAEFSLENLVATTTTELLADDTSPSVNQAVLLTATVSSTDTALSPVGSVDFNVGGDTLCADVPVAAGIATCSTSFATSGNLVVEAVFADADGDFVGSDDTLDIAVGVLSSETALEASDTTPAAGQSVLLTATITSVGGTPDGTVDFTVGGDVLCAGVAVVAGVATCATSFPNAGPVTVTASYSGSDTFGTSQQTLDLTVGPPLGVSIFADGFEGEAP